jgi:EAL domain-containing protein (putative c-di-GMP-specific phosphodiesterase class I)
VPLIVRGLQNLGLRAVAKKVSDPSHLEAAREVGCDFAQGELLGPSLGADEVFGDARLSPAAAAGRPR